MALTPLQLELHNKSITATKVAALLNLSPWDDPLSTYKKMKGEIQVEVEETTRMKMGSYMEDALTKYCVNEYGWRVGTVPESGVKHSEYDFLWCLPDRVRLDERGRIISLLEFKNIDAMFRKQWEEGGVPDYYRCQCHFQSMVCDQPNTLVACFGGNEVTPFDFPRNPDIENFLKAEAVRFWNDLQAGREPEPSGHEASTEALKLLFPTVLLDAVEGTEEQFERLLAMDEYDIVIANATKALEQSKNQFKAEIGTREGVLFPAVKRKVTWKNTNPGPVFNMEQFKIDHPDIYNRYLKPGKSVRQFLYKKR